MKKIDKLIINSPYFEPQQYWEYLRDTREFKLQEGRRPAGYVVASESSKAFDDPGTFIEIDLVNTIRPRIKKWGRRISGCYRNYKKTFTTLARPRRTQRPQIFLLSVRSN